MIETTSNSMTVVATKICHPEIDNFNFQVEHTMHLNYHWISLTTWVHFLPSSISRELVGKLPFLLMIEFVDDCSHVSRMLGGLKYHAVHCF